MSDENFQIGLTPDFGQYGFFNVTLRARAYIWFGVF